MKPLTTLLAAVSFLTLMGITSHAEVLRYHFTDESLEDFLNVFNGDIGSGSVAINITEGSYTVDWHATSEAYSFTGPMHFELSLYNHTTMDLIVLSGDLEAGERTGHFTHGESGVGDLFVDWGDGNSVSTAGTTTIDGIQVEYVSGIYSLNCPGMPCDIVDASGTLVADPAEELPPVADADGDGVQDVGTEGETIDEYPGSDTGPTIILLGQDTWIPNQINGSLATANGYTLADMIHLLHEDAMAAGGTHGRYLQHMVRNLKLLVKDDLISQSQYVGMVRLIAESH